MSTSCSGTSRERPPHGPAVPDQWTAVFTNVPDWKPPGAQQWEDAALILQDWTTIKHTMWNYVGIVRTTERLKRAVVDMRELGIRLTRFYHEAAISKSIVELFHGQDIAMLIANASRRKTLAHTFGKIRPFNPQLQSRFAPGPAQGAHFTYEGLARDTLRGLSKF